MESPVNPFMKLDCPYAGKDFLKLTDKVTHSLFQGSRSNRDGTVLEDTGEEPCWNDEILFTSLASLSS